MANKVDTGKNRKTATDGASDAQPRRKRIDLNVPQVAGSAVAAVVAAKLASSFGVYGTILGAGLVSVIATCGGSVFQHFFSRTGEQVREAAEKAKPRARQVPRTADGRPVPATFRAEPVTTGTGTVGARTATTGPVTTSWRPGVVTAEGDATTALPATSAGAGDRTQLLSSVDGADSDRTQLLASVDTHPLASVNGSDGDRTQLLTKVDAARTQLLTPVRPSEADADATSVLSRADATMLLRATDTGGPHEAADQETRLLGTALPQGHSSEPVPVQGRRIRSWKRPLLGAALIFGVTMAGISTYELVSGNSFSGNDSRVLRPGSWGGSSSAGEHRSTPDDSPSQSTPTEGGSDGGGERTPATDPAATPGGGSGDTATNPEPSPSQSSSDTDPTPEPSPSESETDPTPDPSTPTPTPTDGATDPGQDRGATSAE
ncbi:hypothetical protein RCO28_13680 [Streptomyces sp. LHD-70]|uniref:hypothetical protein n=1 Tax=Streptomyces sp. LHD-70 TaxID=3072140 RepID=UPI00280DB463|nr:hypothetical protein [Streptomyces sp. LHD-70]MDQ8703528.1 hypothetical protein [Streptomyces sp. LHD-70]